MLKHTLLLLLGSVTFAPQVSGQVSAARATDWRDSSARQIVVNLDRLDPMAILRQIGKPQPRAKLDEIADSLAQRAAAVTLSRESNDALGALVRAGRRSLLFDEGTPLPGVLDRLIRIDRELPPANPERTGALLFMLQMPEHTKALDYLLSVATSTATASVTALSAMLAEVNPENKLPRATPPTEIADTRAALRALWDRYSAEPLPPITPYTMIPDTGFPSKVIPNDDARQALEDYARRNNWGGGRKR